MNICMEKEYSLSKNTNIILKKDSCLLLANVLNSVLNWLKSC